VNTVQKYKTISRLANQKTRKIQKKFLPLFTLYKQYTNDTGRANDKRTLTEV